MDTIIAVNPVHTQPTSGKPECIYCLDNKGILLFNRKCHCKYNYHNMCELKSISAGNLSCPMCRHKFGSITEQAVNIQILGPTTFINQTETPGRLTQQERYMYSFAILSIILLSIIPIIYYFQ